MLRASTVLAISGGKAYPFLIYNVLFTILNLLITHILYVGNGTVVVLHPIVCCVTVVRIEPMFELCAE